MIFVFSSNLAGHHCKGTSAIAVQRHGAIYGCAEGLQGNSYAIPTQDEKMRPLSLAAIRQSVRDFLEFARGRPSERFLLTPIGCDAGDYVPGQIAHMFRKAPQNVCLPYAFMTVIMGYGDTHTVMELSDVHERAVRAIDGLIETMQLDDHKFEAVSMAMLACYDRMRELAGDVFVREWLDAARAGLDTPIDGAPELEEANDPYQRIAARLGSK